MSKYVDGFVVPVPLEKLEDYRRLVYGGFNLLVEG